MRAIPTGHEFRPDCRRVVVRPFLPSNPEKVRNFVDRALKLSDAEIDAELQNVRSDFEARHTNVQQSWMRNSEIASSYIPVGRNLSYPQKLFIGCLLSGEYALESAALFNPSMVLHPDQSNLGSDEVRFIISLRATGEGHISSIEFRSGVIKADQTIAIDPVTPFVNLPDLDPDPRFYKSVFTETLAELGADDEWSRSLMSALNNLFSLSELKSAERDSKVAKRSDNLKAEECLRWLTESNYSIYFDPASKISERAIFPVSASESNGIEDARFVRFVESSDEVIYLATYTAYNGRAILPQLIETSDFLKFRICTLSGRASRNKGMALFPRRINGKYAMLSRQDDENLFLMFSDDKYCWNDPVILDKPVYPWQMVKIGNCGSPIETSKGWLVLTHGVGLMRKYCIGVILLDLDDPSRVIGRLKEPLIKPEGLEREGYVPNVVYSCGSMIHKGNLIVPYGFSDSGATIVMFDLEELLTRLTESPVC